MMAVLPIEAPEGGVTLSQPSTDSSGQKMRYGAFWAYETQSCAYQLGIFSWYFKPRMGISGKRTATVTTRPAGTVVLDSTGPGHSRTWDEFVGADVTHAAEVGAVAAVLHARCVVHLIGPDWQAQLRNSVIQRLEYANESSLDAASEWTKINCSVL